MGALVHRSWTRRARTAAVALSLATALLASQAPAALALSPCSDGGLASFDDAYSVAANTKLVVNDPGVLANDCGPASTRVSRPDSDSDSWGGATLTWRANGGFTYQPDPDNPFSGIDTFEYSTIDADDNWDWAEVSVTVPPIVRTDTYVARKDTPLTVDDDTLGVLANDWAVDSVSQNQTVTAHGSVTMEWDGTFEYTPNAGYVGSDSFWYKVWDFDVDLEYQGTVNIVVDGAPTTTALSMSAPTASTALTSKFTVGWKPAIGLPGISATGLSHYQVQVRAASANSATFGAFIDWKASTTATSATFAGVAGRSYCFRARVVDHASDPSSWTASKCTTVPLAASALTYSAGWTRVTKASLYNSAGYKTTTRNARATKTGLAAKRIALVVSKCASCGTLQVRWNNVVKANVNLQSATTRYRQVVTVASWSTVQTGTLTLIVSSPTGKTVLVEGVAVANSP